MEQPKKTAVFVHSYCLRRPAPNETKSLSAMAQSAMEAGLWLIKSYKASDIIVSTSYPKLWKKEAGLQLLQAKEAGVCIEHVHIIGPVRNSYDEAEMAVKKAKELGVDRLIVAAEEWHRPRSKKIFEKIWPGHVEVASFVTPHYEFTLEPSVIKSLCSGSAVTWIFWNFLVGLVPQSWFIKRVGKPRATKTT